MPHDGQAEFRQAREIRLENGRRRMVLFVGSGLHSHLQGHGVTIPTTQHGQSLCDWKALLRSASMDGERAEFEVEHHLNPTATWESMVAKRTSSTQTSRAMHAHQHEEVLQRRVKDIITRATPAHANSLTGLASFGKTLRGCEYADIVTLNFDRTIDRSMHFRGGRAGRVLSSRETRAARYRADLRVDLESVNVWHAHGMADPCARYRSIQLGMVSYAHSVVVVRELIDRYRRRQQEWRRAHPERREWSSTTVAQWANYIRGAPESWVDLVMSSEVAFIGCGLDLAESDVWLLLHERQRQFAHLPEDLRLGAFFLHPSHKFPSSVCDDRSTTGAASLIPVRTSTYDAAWELVIGNWWDSAPGSLAASQQG